MNRTKLRQEQLNGYVHEEDADLLLGVNAGGTTKTAIQVNGDTGAVVLTIAKVS